MVWNWSPPLYEYVRNNKRSSALIKPWLICVDQSEGEYKSSVFLILYEFEAKLMLGDVDVEQVLEKALTLPKVEPDLFENIAGM